ncbi:MAG: outer membrane beta-barrel protein [Fimbriimonadaceae bacterium]|nr:outer membrane beta-barrel protein [Chitinophagales bacterium]
MRKLILIIFSFITIGAFSQRPMQWMEVGVFGGVANYYGDLTQDYVVAGTSKPAFGGFIKYNMGYRMGLKLSLNHGWIAAADSNSTRQNQLLRNLSFESPVTEVALTFEYFFPGFYPKKLHRPLSPYVYTGIAGFHFKPEAFYEGEWYELQPLGTEGQDINELDFREPYSLYDLAIPIGIGVKWAMTERWNLGFEYGARWTFTDYLDDVSRTYADRNTLIEFNGLDAYNLSNRTGEILGGEPIDYSFNDYRGDPTNNDWYMFLGFTLSRNFIPGTEEGFLSLDKPGLGCFQPKKNKKNDKNYHTTR